MKNIITQIKRELNKYKQLTYKDDLTGLRNHRKLVEDINYISKMHLRYKTPYAIIMFDIDKFKEVNDTYGHEYANCKLIQVGTISKMVIRDTDKVYRYGGDEFVIILPYTDIRIAQTILIHLNNELKKHINLTITGAVCKMNKQGNILCKVDSLMMKYKKARV